jgi:hypothetical protein
MFLLVGSLLTFVLSFYEVLVLAAAAPLESSLHCDNSADPEEASSLSLLQLRANASSRTRPAQSSVGGYDSATMKILYPYYHTSAEIHDEIQKLAQGCGGAMTSKSFSDSGVDIDLVHVRAPNSSPVNRVFILFGEHSRELISPESGLRLLQVLCGKVALGERDDGLTVPSILQDTEFQLVLNGNPRSRDRVESGEFCLRTNPSGVDLNRNWDEMWERSFDEDTNSGPTAFSEPETRIFKQLVSKFRPTTFLTVHSGTKGLYMPFSYDMDHQAQYNSKAMLDVLMTLDKQHCQCPFGAAGKEVGYSCPGTCLDWVYAKLKTPYVFAFEIYVSPAMDEFLRQRWDEKMESGGLALLQNGNHLGHEHFSDIFSNKTSDFVQMRATEDSSMVNGDDCFGTFNPGTEDSYNATVHNWAVAYLEMSAKIAGDLKKDENKELLNALAP